MDSSLFQLISIAGNLSLDEMRARGFGDVIRLAHELGSMVRSGNVALSFPSKETGLVSELKNITKRPRRDIDTESLEKALSEVLEDPDIAREITVSPTTLGYKTSIS